LQRYFGRDGREEAEALLTRRSGDDDRPRMLGAFNEETPDWLSFFMFTFFTDRDGKYQLEALAQSGFDPLARTTRFMLTEEAHHMFVGESGIGRVIEATAAAMIAAHIDDPTDAERIRSLNVIDLPTLQRYLNFHFSVSLDLFGAEASSNAANAFAAGLKGRFNEHKIDDDHRLTNSTYPVLRLEETDIVSRDEPALSVLNARLRDDYANDCTNGVKRWNKILEKAGIDYRLSLPHVGFHRRVGEFQMAPIDPSGQVHDGVAFDAIVNPHLPSPDDRAFIHSMMQPTYERGAYASWIAPPKVAIDNKPGDFEFVRLHA
jgi:benzoyl-CoA 2,3-dioxygenase component B